MGFDSRWNGLWIALLFFSISLSCRPQTASKPVVVFAAASTTELLSRLAEEYEARHGVSIQLSFAATSTLARQVQAGAQIDIFISANPEWASILVASSDQQLASRAFLSNQIVIVAAPFNSLPSDIHTWAKQPGRIAIGNPQHVPAGIYALSGLREAGLLEKVTPRFVPTANVREALRLVSKGECDWGLVYASDASAANLPSLNLVLPKGTNIEYRALWFSHRENQHSQVFFEFLFSSFARELAIKMGFQWPR